MKRLLVPLAVVCALTACSSSGKEDGPAADPGAVLTGVPATGATACSVLRKDAVEELYGATVVTMTPSTSPRPQQTLQTGCLLNMEGEKRPTLAVYLWHGDGFKDQWSDEINAVGTDGFTEAPYGVEAYGYAQGTVTELDVAERNYAVRLVCGPSPATPEEGLGLARCARLVGLVDASLTS